MGKLCLLHKKKTMMIIDWFMKTEAIEIDRDI